MKRRVWPVIAVTAMMAMMGASAVLALAQKPPKSGAVAPAKQKSKTPPGAGQAQAKLISVPDHLTIEGYRAFANAPASIETRRLTLRAAKPIINLKFTPIDLYRADEIKVLPATAIRPAPKIKQIPANGLVIVPVEFNLKDVPCGEFSGQLLVSYAGGEVGLPVTVRVKDRWPLPLLLLLAGTSLGVFLSWYRHQGRQRDEILVRRGRVRAAMRADQGLASTFQTRLAGDLAAVQQQLDNNALEDARTSMAQAETVLLKWRRHGDYWIKLLDHQAALLQRAENLGEVPYVQQIRSDLLDAARQAPDGEPDGLRQLLDTAAAKIKRYLDLETHLNELDRLIGQLPEAQAGGWRVKARDLRSRFAVLADQEALDKVQAEARQFMDEINKQPPPPQFSSKGLAAAAFAMAAPALESGAATDEEQAYDARSRLQWFTLVSYGLVVTALAGAAFGQLYVAKPTFGANPWADYFALMAAGFGAEASRASIADLVKSWGLTGTG